MDAQLVFPYASNSFYNRLYQLYPRSNYNSTFYQRVDWFSDFIVSAEGIMLFRLTMFNRSVVQLRIRLKRCRTVATSTLVRFSRYVLVARPCEPGTNKIQMIMSAGMEHATMGPEECPLIITDIL